MDYSGVAGAGSAIVNQIDASVANKPAPKEVSNTPAAAPAQDTARPKRCARCPSPDERRVGKRFNRRRAAQAKTANAAQSQANNLLGQHPLFPFNNNFMDTFKEYVKKLESGDTGVTGSMLETVKSQIGQVKSAITGTAPTAPVPATAAPAAPVGSRSGSR